MYYGLLATNNNNSHQTEFNDTNSSDQPTSHVSSHKSKKIEITSIFGNINCLKSTISLRSMTKNMRFLDPAYLFWAIVWNKWNPLFSGAKIENLNKNLDPGHVFVFSGSKKYFPQHYHSSLQNIDILQRHVNFAPFQKNHFQGYLYFKCALMSNANAYAFIMDISAPRGIVQRYAPKVHFLLLSS